MKRMAHPFQSVAYIQIRRRWLGIQVLTWSGKTGEWIGAPDVLLVQGKKGEVQAYLADDPKVLSKAPFGAFSAFAHPRVLIDRFDDTCRVIDVCLKKAGWKKQMSYAVLVFHIRDEWAGGISDIEQKALMDLAKKLGANRTTLVNSMRELSAPEILQIARGSVNPAKHEAIVIDVP